MKSSKFIKIGIGLLTVWMILSPFILFGILSRLATIEPAPDTPDPTWIGTPGFPILILFALIAVIMIIVQLGLVGYYWAHIARNPSISEVAKIMLAVGVLILPYIAMPVYFYRYVWRS